MVNVRVSLTVARWMRDLAIRLFQEGYNTDWTPENAENAVYGENGFVNNIPADDIYTRAWIEACMNLLRCLAAILSEETDDSDVSDLNNLFGDEEV